MLGIKKKQNLKSEEHFHDQWAKSVSVEELDVIAQFEGATSPEYKEVFSSAGDINRKRVLVLGCGLGEEAVYFALKGAKVTAVDISTKMLETTKKLAEKYNVANKIICKKMNIEKMSFQNDYFDAVIGCNVLHHVNIKKTVKETKRVLKKGGKVVFAEPLAYNPAINVYRVMANEVRTDDEHPLSIKDIKEIYKIFPSSKRKEFHFFTLLIFVWFFIAEKTNPNKIRYWKKIITEGKKYEKPFRILFLIDKLVFKVLPYFRKYSWVTVITSQKE